MAEMHEMDLLPLSLFRDEEHLRVAVKCFDLEKKTLGLKEKFLTNRNHGGSKRRKLKLENSRLWKNLLGHLRSELDQVASTMAQIIGLGLKPNRSLGVKCARVGFKPILKKVRESVSAERVLSSVVVEFDLNPDPDSGMGSFSGTCPDAVLDFGFRLLLWRLGSNGSALGFAGSALGGHVSQEMGSPRGFLQSLLWKNPRLSL